MILPAPITLHFEHYISGTLETETTTLDYILAFTKLYMVQI